MKILRTGVIGLGRVGWQKHIPQIRGHDGFELMAVVDPLPERLEEARIEFGVKGYRDHKSMLAGEKLDLVVIASPTPFHAEQAAAAFEAGVDVFCDKPIATSLSETESMIASAEAHGRKLMAYQPHRTYPEGVALKEILKRDLIGPVYMIKCAMSRWRRRNDWQALKEYGGGMLCNYGAHIIDLLLYLTKSRAKRISCALRTVASLGDADDVVKAVIETDSGVILDMDINQAAAWPMERWHVMGERGGAIYDHESKTWKVRYYRQEELPALKLQGTMAAEGRIYRIGQDIPWREETFSLSDFPEMDFYQKCYEHFALDQEPFVSLAETRELMRVLEQARLSAAQSGEL